MTNEYLANAIARARSGAYPDICDAEFILEELDRVKATLEAENAALRKALSYYSDEHENPNTGPWGVNSTDFGKVARKALGDSHN